jgi:hypothetical protein
MNEQETDRVAQAYNDLEKSGHRCPKCGKIFTNKQGLGMHTVRMHTRAGKRGWRLAVKRATGRHKRRGTKKKVYPSNTPEAARARYRLYRDRYFAMGLNAKGQPFKSAASRRAHDVAMRWRARQRPEPATGGAGAKLAAYVYPTPAHLLDKRPEAEPAAATPDMIKYCPYCGKSIEKHL